MNYEYIVPKFAPSRAAPAVGEATGTAHATVDDFLAARAPLMPSTPHAIEPPDPAGAMDDLDRMMAITRDMSSDGWP
jgi:hypothetical protein